METQRKYALRTVYILMGLSYMLSMLTSDLVFNLATVDALHQYYCTLVQGKSFNYEQTQSSLL